MPTKLKTIDTPNPDESNGKWRHLVKLCLDLYDQFSNSAYRKKKLDEIRESYEAYDQIDKPTTTPWEGANSFNLPTVTVSADNLEPRLVAGLVGKKPYVKLEMENEQDQDENTEIIETWFNQELEDNVRIPDIASKLISKLINEGTVYPMPYYDLSEETHKDFVYFDDIMQQLVPAIEEASQEFNQAQAMIAAAPADEQVEEAQRAIVESQQKLHNLQAQIPQQIGGIVIDPQTGQPMSTDVKKTIFEGGRVELVPFKDVFIADNVDDWEEAPIIRKLRKSYADLLSDVKTKPGFKINGKTVIGPWICDLKGGPQANSDDQSVIQEQEGAKETGTETIELLEVSINYVLRDIEKDEKDHSNYESEKLIAWIEPQHRLLVRLLPLRELNFKNQHLIKRMRLFPRTGMSYGTCVYGKLKAIQKGLNKVFNTSLDIAELIMIPWGFFDDTAGFERYAKGKNTKLKLTPGAWFPIGNVKGLYTPTFNVRPDQMFRWMELFMMFWERLLSIGDLQVGRQGSKNTTATETMAVIQEGNIKHNYQSATIKEDFLSVIRTLYDLYYQYMPLDKTVLWNKQQVPINRKQMSRGYKFRLTGSTDLSNKLIERREKESFYQLTAADPMINPVKKAEELVRAYNHSDLKEWIKPGIKPIIDQLINVPNAMQLVQKALQEAQMIADDIQGKQK